MKNRLLFSLLVLGVIALIVTAAKLTTSFFNLSRPFEKVTESVKSTGKDSKQSVPPGTENVLETVIEVSETQDKQAQIASSIKPQQTKPVISGSGKTTEEPQPKPDVEKPQRPGIGTVIESGGTVTGTSEKMVQRELKINARVYMNEKIETGPESRIEIRFDDNSIISQGENSSILIDEYVYQPDKKDENRFGMRIIKGMCRVVTGMITEINPTRFNVKTRMATIGIRGCELAFRSQNERDDIYVVALSGEKAVEIQASKSGKLINNVQTGAPIPNGRTDLTTFTIAKSMQMISVINEKGTTQRDMNPKDIREMIKESSSMSPAKYEMQNSRSGSIFLLKPEITIK